MGLNDGLSNMQKKAVESIDDDLEIIACAGAGKTGVVTRRIINILKSKPDILPERLFERYCESNDNVEWFYKNGDSGQQYLSVVYTDALLKQWLFYPDYIVHMKDGTDWIIETKGGEQAGHSKNIDAFKSYAEKYNLNWGFVRDSNEELYINNTKYADDMSDDNWRNLADVF